LIPLTVLVSCLLTKLYFWLYLEKINHLVEEKT